MAIPPISYNILRNLKLREKAYDHRADRARHRAHGHDRHLSVMALLARTCSARLSPAATRSTCW